MYVTKKFLFVPCYWKSTQENVLNEQPAIHTEIYLSEMMKWIWLENVHFTCKTSPLEFLWEKLP